MLLCQYHSDLDFGGGMSGISKGLNKGNAMVPLRGAARDRPDRARRTGRRI